MKYHGMQPGCITKTDIMKYHGMMRGISQTQISNMIQPTKEMGEKVTTLGLEDVEPWGHSYFIPLIHGTRKVFTIGVFDKITNSLEFLKYVGKTMS